MSKILCTFSGKLGDILWSLPTVRKLAQIHGAPVDLGIMPQYVSLLSLLEHQEYIDKAFVIDNWILQHSCHGDQPWEAPSLQGYDKTYHLAYRRHPRSNEPLIDFIAMQQGLVLDEPVVPFINQNKWFAIPTTEYEKELARSLSAFDLRFGDYVAIAFNVDYAPEKLLFLQTLFGDGNVVFVDVTKLSWDIAAFVIASASCYIGDRSSNWVLANGVGQKNIFIYEPHPNRHAQGQLGQTFGNPHWHEVYSPFFASPTEAAEIASRQIGIWMYESIQRRLKNEPVTTT